MILLQVKTRRTKKKKPKLVRGLMSYLLLMCVLFGTAFIYVKQRNTVTKMGYEIGRLRNSLTRLEQENHSLDLRYSELILPDRMKDVTAALGLNLREVEHGQKVTRAKPKAIILTGDEDTLPATGESNEDRRLVKRQ